MDTMDMGERLKDVLATAEQLGQRLVEATKEIDRGYVGKEILLVGVLRRVVMVMTNLSRRIHTPPGMDQMAVSSYGSGTKSSGVAHILKDLDQDVSGRRVLIVGDTIDSGLILFQLRTNLLSRRTASVRIATTLRKPTAAKVEVEVAYVSFEIPNELIVGYGLDYAGKYRNLPFVGTLALHVYEN